MNTTDKENLKELFEKFLDPQQAIEATEDIRKGEQILREHPAPEPDKELIASIKSEITATLLNKQANVFRKIAYRVSAVAAAVIIIAAIGLNLLKKDSSSEKLMSASIIPSAIWEGDNVTTDDVELALFTAEIEQIENQLRVLQLGENGENGDRALDELKMEFLEINNDFWKG